MKQRETLETIPRNYKPIGKRALLFDLSTGLSESKTMKDDTTTELGKYLYKFAPVHKTDIDLEVLDDLALSFCVREGYTYRGYMHIDTVLWVLIAMQPAQESMSMYTEFKKAFEAHGYSAPRLSIETILNKGV